MPKTGGVATNTLKYAGSKPADGQTLFIVNAGTAPTMMRGTVDLTKDDIIALVRGTVDPEFVVVKAGRFADAAAFIDDVQNNSVKQAGTKVGNTPHVSALIFRNALEMQKQVYVPFEKSGEIILNVINGNVDMALLNFDEFASQAKAGQVEALAILTPERSDNSPGVPTGHEVGNLVMIVATPLLAKVAYHFGPAEFFALAVFGMSMLASISGNSMVKNFIGGAFGLLLATVGTDLTTGIERFTFGQAHLCEGIAVVQIMIGIFAGGELLRQATQTKVQRKLVAEGVTKLPSMADFKAIWKTVLRATGIGPFIGILPAEGGMVAAMIAYNEEMRRSKNKDQFGNGSIQGLAAPEAANNVVMGLILGELIETSLKQS